MPLWRRSRPRKRSRRPPRSAEAGPPTPRRSFCCYRGELASWPKRGFGVAHAQSPDVRSGTGPVSSCACPLPGLGLTAPRRRTFASAIHGLRSLRAACAFALRAALAGEAVSRGTANPSQKISVVRGADWLLAIRRCVAGCDANQAKKGHGWLFLRSSQCGRKVWRIVTWRTWRLVGS